MTKTYYVKPGEVEKKWHLIDVAEQPVGRISAVISQLLRGKHKPQYTPNADLGDYVVVINADKVKFSGNKELTKLYFSHSGYLGHLKETTAAQMRQKHPERILEYAVHGMLPKNKLNRHILKKLFIYPGAEHKHHAQKPVPYTTTKK
jgi:large subunit ribosomal protein L13